VWASIWPHSTKPDNRCVDNQRILVGQHREIISNAVAVSWKCRDEAGPRPGLLLYKQASGAKKLLRKMSASCTLFDAKEALLKEANKE
jgi:hypothetical protein